MKKRTIFFFVVWLVLFVFVITTETWCYHNPIHSLHNDLRCLAFDFHNMLETESITYWIAAEHYLEASIMETSLSLTTTSMYVLNWMTLIK